MYTTIRVKGTKRESVLLVIFPNGKEGMSVVSSMYVASSICPNAVTPVFSASYIATGISKHVFSLVGIKSWCVSPPSVNWTLLTGRHMIPALIL